MATSTYTQEFKDKAVMMYIDGKSSQDVGRELGISHMTVQAWVKKSGFETRKPGRHTDAEEKQVVSMSAPLPPKKTDGDINPLLLSMADGNDLSAFVGKEICKMTPREIYKFLELLNIKGDLMIVQKIRLK